MKKRKSFNFTNKEEKSGNKFFRSDKKEQSLPEELENILL
jgi:hypothetical protein